MSGERIFIDTWAWLALGHRKDSFHDKVEKIFKQIQSDNMLLFSSEYVLDELITLLFRRENYTESVRFTDTILTAVKNGELVIEKISEDRFQRSWQLRKRLKDKPDISFTDITSMIVMQELLIPYILTDDDHFKYTGFNFIKIP
jgi:predicted nucleic acid-binding protein